MNRTHCWNVLAAALSVGASSVFGQTLPGQFRSQLAETLLKSDVTVEQIRQFIDRRIPALPQPKSAVEWTSTATRLRSRILSDVVFRGWPDEWIQSPMSIETIGAPIPGKGYTLQKLRIGIVPGMVTTAILYRPAAAVPGKAPAVLHLHGHVGAPGKSVEYKQKIAISQARQGFVALNMEWLGYGELMGPGSSHYFGSHLDLAGVNSLGLFYLAMRRGLDYLESLSFVDAKRLGVTGLSGGGWQSIVLAALDERVAAVAPNAGYSSMRSRIERVEDIGDYEQNATDLLLHADYPHLTALLAPRPSLLIYNAEDDCCFKAPLVKKDVYDAVRPIFALFDRPGNFLWHENTEPGDHNYHLDNRRQAYRFFARALDLAGTADETSTEGEIKSYDELTVGLPTGNLSILDLARKIAGLHHAARGRAPQPEDQRQQLREIVRHEPAQIQRAWLLNSTRRKGLATRSHRFDFSNGTSASGVWCESLETAGRPVNAAILLHDSGKKELSVPASNGVNRGEIVLAFDPLFVGDAVTQAPAPFGYANLLIATGARPLGMQAAQLIAAAKWLRKESGVAAVRLESHGMRTQLIARVVAALEPDLFSGVATMGGIASLQDVFDKPVTFLDAPEMFPFDLYRHFDVASLEHLGSTRKSR